MKKEKLNIFFHDLRAPVVGIRGYLKMLLDGSFGELPTQAREKLQLVVNETEKLHDQIETMIAAMNQKN